MWKGLGNCRKIILSEKVRTIVTNFCEKGYWSSVDIKGKILIISVYIQGLVVMLNLGSRNVWINGRCCVLVWYLMKLLSTGSHSPVLWEPEVSPWLYTGSYSVFINRILWARCWNRKLFRSWKSDIVNRKLFRSWKPDIVNLKLKTEFVNRKL